MGGLSQSDKLFGALLIAFLIYITVRGQLPAPKGYLGIFVHSAAPVVTPSAPKSSGGGLSDALNIAKTAFDIAKNFF